MMAAIPACGQKDPPLHEQQQQQYTRPRRVLRRTKLFMRRRLGMARQDLLLIDGIDHRQVTTGPLPRIYVLEKPDCSEEHSSEDDHQQEQQEQQEPTENV